MGDKKNWDNTNLRKYDICLNEIPRIHCRDPRIDDYITQNRPVVITDSNIVKPAKERLNLDYLEKHMGCSTHTVFISKNHKFTYYDEKKIWSKANPKGTDFTPVTTKVEMNISEFLHKIKEWKKGDDRLYLQQSVNSSLGQALVNDFLNFDWEYITSKQNNHCWGPLTSNLLFVSMEGNVTPCHYDEQENFFAQVYGYKRCILFAPDQYECLYPYPVHHPHDRQTMVDFDRPDYTKFPKFKQVVGHEAILGPGEVLYIPVYWWHHIESLMRAGPTITINFWYKAGPTNIEYPLKDYQKVSIMRNIEKMLLEVLQDPKEVGPLLNTMVCGRFNNT